MTGRARKPGRGAGGRTGLAVAFLVLAATLAPLRAGPSAADPPSIPGAGAARPRVLFAPDQVDDLRARLAREPYRTLFLTLHARAESFAAAYPPGDFTIPAQRALSSAAKDLAFEYALDRTVSGGEIVAFADEAARSATGDRVRALLPQLYTRSRMAVAPPLGGYDRDINTSEELINYATAFDTILGAGYEFGADEAVITERLVALASELYDNYVHPETAGGVALLMQNNHRSKSGAALAVAAIVLADYVAPPGSDPRGVKVPADWWDYGVLQVDDVLRYMLVAGDGAYAEGAYYYRYTSMNTLPLARAWERHLGAASWAVHGIEVPPLWHHPLYARTQRWMLDTTVPDGGMAPIDDGNPNRSYYFGLLPSSLPEYAAYAWRWADMPQDLDSDGAIDLYADAIVSYDESVIPREPWWSPTQFYVEGGSAIFRSGWDRDAVEVVALGEHDTASEFGRDRTGLGRSPQSHEHPDPASFMLYAFGERLALDPGYLTFTTHGLVNRPEHHNIVLVDGEGPPDYLLASLGWLSNPWGRPPVEGQSTISDTLDGAGLDAASVATWYRGAEIDRRFVFADDRYLIAADAVASDGGAARDYTWMLHGNGGGTSGGTFTPTPTGGRWQVGGARLDGALALAGATPAFTTADFTHERAYQEALTHTALQASATAVDPRALQVLYPTRAGDPPPEVTTLDHEGVAALHLSDPAGDRTVDVTRRGGSTEPLVAGDALTDGDLLLADTYADDAPRLLLADGATTLSHGGVTYLDTVTPGSLGLRLASEGRVDVVAGGADPSVTVGGLGFTPVAVDGACSLTAGPNGTVAVTLGRERRIALRADDGNARPAADPGPDRRVTAGSSVTLDGGRSCDADGDALTPHWELVSAPAGSAWSLTGADTFAPALTADRVGPYRVRLTVTDEHGAASLESEVVVIAGERCADGVDDDLDGRIDTDDLDDGDGSPCDGPANAAPLAAPDDLTTRRDRPVTLASPGVLADDSDPEGGPVAAVLVTAPQHGSAALAPDGGLTYTPDAGFTGSDSFTYLARDAGYAESEPAEVTIEVAPPIDAVALAYDGALDHAVMAVARADAFTVRRDAHGAPLAVWGRADLGGRAHVALLALRAGRCWHGAVVLRDPALGPSPVTTALRCTSVAEPAPGLLVGTAHGRHRGHRYRLNWAVLDDW